MSARFENARRLNDKTDRQIRERHNKRRRMRKRKLLISRIVILAVLVSIILFVIMFLTPIFNIKSVEITGNDRISAESLQEYLSSINGKNIFEVSDSYVENKLEAIAYIESVDVEKKYFPSKVTIKVTEKNPCAYIEVGDGYSVLDENCVSLEKRSDEPDFVPLLSTYFETSDDFLKDEEAVNSIRTFFDIITRIEIKDGITAIELKDFNEIEFEFNGRLNVVCGSNVELEQKLRLFKATINNPNLSPNAHGTIDLSTPGKAMHKP